VDKLDRRFHSVACRWLVSIVPVMKQQRATLSEELRQQSVALASNAFRNSGALDGFADIAGSSD